MVFTGNEPPPVVRPAEAGADCAAAASAMPLPLVDEQDWEAFFSNIAALPVPALPLSPSFQSSFYDFSKGDMPGAGAAAGFADSAYATALDSDRLATAATLSDLGADASHMDIDFELNTVAPDFWCAAARDGGEDGEHVGHTDVLRSAAGPESATARPWQQAHDSGLTLPAPGSGLGSAPDVSVSTEDTGATTTAGLPVNIDNDNTTTTVPPRCDEQVQAAALIVAAPVVVIAAVADSRETQDALVPMEQSPTGFIEESGDMEENASLPMLPDFDPAALLPLDMDMCLPQSYNSSRATTEGDSSVVETAAAVVDGTGMAVVVDGVTLELGGTPAQFRQMLKNNPQLTTGDVARLRRERRRLLNRKYQHDSRARKTATLTAATSILATMAGTHRPSPCVPSSRVARPSRSRVAVAAAATPTNTAATTTTTVAASASDSVHMHQDHHAVAGPALGVAGAAAGSSLGPPASPGPAASPGPTAVPTTARIGSPLFAYACDVRMLLASQISDSNQLQVVLQALSSLDRIHGVGS